MYILSSVMRRANKHYERRIEGVSKGVCDLLIGVGSLEKRRV